MDQIQVLKGAAILAVIVGVVLILAGLVDVSSGRAGTSELVSGLTAVVVGALSLQLARGKLGQPPEPATVDRSPHAESTSRQG
jgi:hypothetical protein